MLVGQPVREEKRLARIPINHDKKGATASGSQAVSASRHGRDDRHLVARTQRCLQAREEPDVFAVDVEIDESPKLARVIAQPSAHLGVALLELAQCAVNAAALDVYLRLARGNRP